jgi:hypothetical protein
MRSVNYRAIEELLKKGTSTADLSQPQSPNVPAHENIRGSAYYC